CWSTLVIGLIFVVGRRLFGTWPGLLAAGVYTVTPSCIAMSTFGRYFDQLQFFALLTVYYFWRTVQGDGRVHGKALWATTASFLAMFFTWEASALIAPGMVLAALVQRRGRLAPLLRSP